MADEEEADFIEVTVSIHTSAGREIKYYWPRVVEGRFQVKDNQLLLFGRIEGSK